MKSSLINKMTTVVASIAVLLLMSISNANAFMAVDYKLAMDNVTRVTFPIKLIKVEKTKTYFFSMQYGFHGDKANGGYIGIQPQADGGLRAIFSVFGKDTEVINKEQCNGGADGGKGVSCRLNIPKMKMNSFYYLTVVQDNKDPHIWRGYISDNKQNPTPDDGLIGAWKTNKNSGTISMGNSGFVENLPWTNKVGLKALTGIEAEFASPYTNNRAEERGQITKFNLNGRWKEIIKPYTKSQATKLGGMTIKYTPPAVTDETTRSSTSGDDDNVVPFLDSDMK